MADFDFKTQADENAVPDGAIVFGADSHSAATPVNYPAKKLTTALKYTPTGTGTYEQKVTRELNQTVSILRWIDPSEDAAIAAYTSTTNFASNIQQAIDDTHTAGGGIIKFPRGNFYHSGISLRNKKSITLQGSTGIDIDFIANRGSVLIFTGEAGTMRGIDMRGTEGCSLEMMSVAYSGTTFDGYLVDYAYPFDEYVTGNKGHVKNCSFYQIASNTRTARCALNLYRCIEVHAIDNYFTGFQVGITGAPHSVVTISNATPGVVTWANHGLLANEPVTFETTGGLPTGLTARTIYYVKTVLTTSTFTVSATAGGAAIATSSAGSGVHTGSTICQLESIDLTLERNQYAVMAIAGVTNPGIGWKIRDDVFEPDTGYIPLGIKAIGGNLTINVNMESLVFADGYATGIYIDLYSSLNSSITTCSFGSDGIADVTGIKVRGPTVGGTFSPNYFTFVKKAIVYEGAILGHTATANNMSTVWAPYADYATAAADLFALAEPIDGMSFGDETCYFSGNYPNQVKLVTGLANILDTVEVFSKTDLVRKRVPTAALLPRLAAAPGSPVEGDSYYNTTTHKTQTWDGTAWNNHW